MVAWPEDETRQSHFLCAAGARLAHLEQEMLSVAASDEARAVHAEMAAAWEELYQKQGSRQTLIEAQGLATLVRDFELARHDAALAGRVLGLALRLANDPRVGAAASLNKAMAIVFGHVAQRVPTVLPLPKSKRPVADAWRTHRCVAPYACAIEGHRSRDARRGPQGERQDPIPTRITETGLVDVLRLAERLKLMAAAFVPHSRSGPLIAREDMLDLVRQIEPLPEGEVELLPLPADYLASQEICG